MKSFTVLFLCFTVVVALSGWYIMQKTQKVVSPIGNQPKTKPLDAYTFVHLRSRVFLPSQIKLGRKLQSVTGVVSYMFYYAVDGKEVSGLLNMPDKRGTFPLIVMFRGYVDKDQYTSGVGTQHAGEAFAQNGFITLAPDFLGYGESELAVKDAMEDRFLTYTTGLTLLSSLGTLNEAVEHDNKIIAKADATKIGIWGHSNGGHIALSIAEISGKPYPTVLWAPVSKPFPYSILYFTDEADDHGKQLRKALASFEENYDVEKYSPTNFLDWITAPLEIHQGSQDKAVPQQWSDDLVNKLQEMKKDVTYFVYPQADHNFSPIGWNDAITRSIEFYAKHFQ